MDGPLTLLAWIEYLGSGTNGSGDAEPVGILPESGDGAFRLGNAGRQTTGPDCPFIPSLELRTKSRRFELLGTAELNPGFHHLAATYDTKVIRLSVNGSLVAEQAVSGRLHDGTVPHAHRAKNAFCGTVHFSEVLPAAVTPLEISVMARAHHRQARESERFRIELDTHSVFDGRSTLKGQISFGKEHEEPIELALCAHGSISPVWRIVIPSASSRTGTEFDVPLVGLDAGYYHLEARTASKLAATVDFAHCKTPNPVHAKKTATAPYLSAAKQAMDAIIAVQTRSLPAHAGGNRFITTGTTSQLAYRSLIHKTGGTFATMRFPEEPLEIETFRADHELWPTLDLLSELTGDDRYRLMAEEMIHAYGNCGFDTASGLPFLSEECDLDVLRAAPCSKGSAADEARFKPVNSGPRTDMHLPRFWHHHPEKTLRWLRAAYRGLVTDPESMDFNRYCAYGFDDRGREPALTRNNSHCGFESAASSLILFWAFGWSRTGDADCLDWAERMTRKWAEVQHPETGFVPNFFGAGAPLFLEPMDAGTWTESRGLAIAAEQWLRAASYLRQRPGAEELSLRLHGMGEKAATHLALHAYDEGNRRFVEHLNGDGSVWQGTARYGFQTEEEKQAAVRTNPLLQEVPVFQGTGFYLQPNYYEACAGSPIPYHLSGAAELCRNAQLIERLALISRHAAEEASQIQGAFTPQHRWTFRASGWNVQLSLRLHALTGSETHLHEARGIADRELAALAGTPSPNWWRMRERTVWLDALLQLHKAQLR